MKLNYSFQTFLLLAFIALSPLQPALSQIPQGFNYQAIARDGSGNPIISLTLPVRITIQTSLSGGTIVWQETHSSLTDPYGVFSLVVGTGTRTGGLASFSDITWGSQTLYLKTEIKFPVDNINYTELGTTQLWSVPFSMASRRLVGAQSALEVTGDARLANHIFGGTNIELNQYGTGNRHAFIDLHGDDTYTDYSLRLIRNNTGPNATSTLYSRGTGGLELYNQEAAPIRFYTSSAVRMTINSSGNVGIGNPAPAGKLSVQVPTDAWADEIPIFEVKNEKGVPVLAVYNYGVRILVDHNDAKAVKGGFAVSSYDYTKAGGTIPLMIVNPDSIRFNINNSSTKGSKGGFAVGSFADTKGPVDQDFMYLTPSNTGNAYNTFMGYQAGRNNVYGNYNTFIGYQAGLNHVGYSVPGGTGNGNLYMGYRAGYSPTYGTQNCFLGYESGYQADRSIGLVFANTFIGFRSGVRSSGGSNILIGNSAGYDAASYGSKTSNGSHNIMIGNTAGAAYSTGSHNTVLGQASAFHLSTGNHNVCVGEFTGFHMRSSYNNVLIGNFAGQDIGSNQPNPNYSNVVIGYYAGNNLIGNGNVLIGNEAGRDLTVVHNKLYIDNAANAVPLIYGDFASKRIGFGTNDPGHKLDVRETVTNGFVASVSNNGNTATSHGMRIIAGNSTSTGATFIRFEKGVYGSSTAIGSIHHNGTSTVAYATSSDERIKRDIHQTSLGLADLMKIGVYDFTFTFDETNSQQTGFLAQQLYDIYPAAVCKPQDTEDLWMVDYSKVSPLVVKAIQEQQALIEAQNDKINRLEKLVEQLMSSR